MSKKVIGSVVAAGVAVLALVGIGAGTASAADPTCLVESTQATAADPVGATGATLADPAGTVESDVACAEEVLGR
jgi:hypothetical protein